MRCFQAAIFCAAVLLVGAAARPAAVPSPKTLLDSLRKAMLARPAASIISIHTVGSVELLGIRGRAQEWDDVRGARFTVDQNAGALSGASGWDGKVAWSQDYAGLVTIDGGEAGRIQAIDQAYLDNLRYLRPDAGGAVVIYAGRRGSGGAAYDVLAVTPPQGSELDLWLDPRSHLIDRVTTSIGLQTSTTEYSGYRRVDGVLYPFVTSSSTSSGNSFSQRTLSVEFNTDVADRMRVPGQNVHDFAISGGSSTSVPIEVANNHVYIPGVMLDGHGPYTFVLDSGGDYIVTPEVAAALNAKTSGGVQLQGVGSATEGASFTRVASISVGRATVRDQYMLVLPIATGFGMAEGMRIDGMVGYQFLARFLTTIDYDGSKLMLAMPSAQPAEAPGTASMQFFIDGTIPRININVNSVTVSAEVDTGNRAALDLSSPFLAAHPGLGAYVKTPAVVTGFGVGGPSYGRLARIPLLQVGPYALSNVVASFADQSKGAFADPFDPANIGGDLLRRFIVTFDYAHHQILLAKGLQFDAPFVYDRSGLFLIDAKGAYTVISVVPGSAAAKAGIRKGDAIVAVDGAPASSESLAALRAQLSAAPGTVVRMRVRDAQAGTRDVTLTLADYV